jgi:hypothetical protein
LNGLEKTTSSRVRLVKLRARRKVGFSDKS